MTYTHFDDQTLITMIVQQDEDALSELYRRYHRLVFSLAINSVGNQMIAEEITLDVFTNVWQKADTYQPNQAQVNTWLTRIARNRAIDILRNANFKSNQQAVTWAEIDDNLPSSALGPEHRTEAILQQERVRRAVKQLPVEQQKVLALAYFKGYSHRQIADALSEPLGTVKTRIRQGMKKLRFLLSEE